MRALTLDDLGGAEFDDAIDSTRGIDRFCSSSDWVVPAHEGLMPPRETVIARDGGLWFAGALRPLQDGVRLLEPLEASWALASPIVGARGSDDAGRIADWLHGRRDWDVALIAGLITGGNLLDVAMRQLAERFQLRLSSETPRYVADLEAGLDAYFGRRSRNFRRSLVKACRRCEREGVELEAAEASTDEASDALFERLVAVEKQSWKGIEGVGIDEGRMRDFYRLICRRLASRGRLRCWFARQGDRDLGYVLGGVRGSLYRGLQFSYVDDMAHLSLGNFMQVEQMKRLIGEGITRYDLGSDAHYKHRWADWIESSPVVFAFRT